MSEYLIPRKNNEKILFIVLDGAGDRPAPRTPLQAAKKPNLDALAARSACGLLHPMAPGIRPGSGVAHLSIFGYAPSDYPGRGVIEALGSGVALAPGDGAVRCNFAVKRNGVITDRRAGRIGDAEARTLAEMINAELGTKRLSFVHVKEHRCAIVLRGIGACNISDSDPEREGSAPQPIRALDGESKDAAKTVARFIGDAERLLQDSAANAILTRGSGAYKRIDGFAERYLLNAACVAGYPQYRGVGRYLGMKIIECSDDELGEKGIAERFDKAIAALHSSDFVYMHLKALDEFGEDGDWERKRKYIEIYDRHFAKLRGIGAFVVVTSDHSTPASLRSHSGDAVPIMISGRGVRCGGVKRFDEISCSSGTLGHIRGADVMPLLLDIADKVKKYKA